MRGWQSTIFLAKMGDGQLGDGTLIWKAIKISPWQRFAQRRDASLPFFLFFISNDVGNEQKRQFVPRVFKIV